MLHMGDEYGHTKAGNNNTYCHDGPLNWFDWRAAAADAGGLRRFVAALAHLRARHPELRRTSYVQDGEIEWHGAAPGEPDWSADARLVAASLRRGDGGGLFVAFSNAHVPSVVGVPEWAGREWVVVVDTGKVGEMEGVRAWRRGALGRPPETAPTTPLTPQPAPYDALVDDGALTPDQLAAARAAASTWLADGAYPLLPYSALVLESVPVDGGAAAA